MLRVLKYSVPPAGTSEGICLPEGARILHVDAQGRQVNVWALVDPYRAGGPLRHIAYYATGEPVPEGATYIGTALMHGGDFVWHVFEEAPDA